jgi:hypothetical protein
MEADFFCELETVLTTIESLHAILSKNNFIKGAHLFPEKLMLKTLDSQLS